MKRLEIKNSSGKVLALVFSFLDSFNLKDTNKEILNKIISEVPYLDSCGYAGYLNKEDLKECIDFYLPLDSKNKKSFNPDIKKVFLEIKKSIEKCSSVLEEDILNIFIFPSFDSFIEEKMFGNSGFTPWKNTIHLYINSVQKNKISYTLAHEIAHALSPYPNEEGNPIGSILLYEGIAEHFRENFLGGEKSPWSKAISDKKAKEILEGIDLRKKDFGLYKDLFFGSEKFPLWSGYTLGYKTASHYLKKIRKVDWSSMVRKNMKKEISKLKINEILQS